MCVCAKELYTTTASTLTKQSHRSNQIDRNFCVNQLQLSTILISIVMISSFFHNLSIDIVDHFITHFSLLFRKQIHCDSEMPITRNHLIWMLNKCEKTFIVLGFFILILVSELKRKPCEFMQIFIKFHAIHSNKIYTPK